MPAQALVVLARHGAGARHRGVGAENVALGQLLHQESYPGKPRKDVLIDDLLRLDFTEAGVVHEVKKSQGGMKATRYQLLYYLYYLKHEKGVDTTGVIDFPKERRREEVMLTPDLEAEVEHIVAGVQRTRQSPTPPVVPSPCPSARSAPTKNCAGDRSQRRRREGIP